MKPLEKRKTEFESLVRRISIERGDQPDMTEDFLSFWTEHNEPIRANTKMKWEKREIFQIPKRIATWKRICDNGFGKANVASKKVDRYPNYLSRALVSRLDAREFQEYKKHLIKLGYRFGGGATGHWVMPPEGERIWL